jgi:hypothetical protein
MHELSAMLVAIAAFVGIFVLIESELLKAIRLATLIQP